MATQTKPLSMAQHHQRLIDLAFGLVRATIFTSPLDAPTRKAEVNAGAYNEMFDYLHQDCPKPVEFPPNARVTIAHVDNPQLILIAKQVEPGQWVAWAEDDGRMIPGTYKATADLNNWDEALRAVQEEL